MTLFSNVFASIAPRGSRRIRGREAWRLVESGAVLLDVRTAGEVAHGMADGAVNIPLSELTSRLHELPSDRAVVVYCHSGGRSASAAAILGRKGYRVYDAGGLGDLLR